MRKLAVVEFVTLDGVMQSLGGPDEDRDGGFEYGGWSAPYGDEVLAGGPDPGSVRPRPTCSAAGPTSTWRHTGRTNLSRTQSQPASTPRQSTS